MGFKLNQSVEHLLRENIPELLAIYVFGSKVQGTANTQSDLDLAVLVAGYADPLLLWDLSGKIADLVGSDVDLLDFRAASTVMQYQILTGRALLGAGCAGWPLCGCCEFLPDNSTPVRKWQQ